MTTIAWDGKVLAGDRMISLGETPTRAVLPKVQRLQAPDGSPALFGCCGISYMQEAFVHWLQGGKEPTWGASFAVILILSDGSAWVRSENANGWVRHAGKWALGSGCDYALGAMEAGVDAIEAVHISSRLDKGTGFGVDAVTFDGQVRLPEFRSAKWSYNKGAALW